MNPLSSQCTATAKRSGKRCLQPVVGGGVCYHHGGRAPQVEARRQARILEGEARLAGEVVELRDPGEALLAAAQDADVILQRLKAQLATGDLKGPDLLALGDWVDRVSRVSKTVLDARIDERQVRLVERQVQLLVGMLQRVAGRMELSPVQRSLWPIVVGDELRRVGAAERRQITGGS